VNFSNSLYEASIAQIPKAAKVTTRKENYMVMSLLSVYTRQAGLPKSCRLGDLNHRNSFLMVLEAGSPRWTFSRIWFLVRDFFPPDLQMAAFLLQSSFSFTLSTCREWQGELSLYSASGSCLQS
jgi:hypothetical protein